MYILLFLRRVFCICHIDLFVLFRFSAHWWFSFYQFCQLMRGVWKSPMTTLDFVHFSFSVFLDVFWGSWLVHIHLGRLCLLRGSVFVSTCNISVFLVTFFAVKSTWLDINIVTPILKLFVWYVSYSPFTQLIYIIEFEASFLKTACHWAMFIHSAGLFIGVFRSFTFDNYWYAQA